MLLENNVKTIAFPAISCGVYGYPVEQACEIAMSEIIKFLSNNDSIEKVIFTCFGQDIYRAYVETFEREFGENQPPQSF